MKKIGFLKPKKENEKRIALLPDEVKKIKNAGHLFFEADYGKDLNFSDADYTSAGATVCDRKDIFSADIICDFKMPLIEDFQFIPEHTVLFGWVHAVQGRKITDAIVNRKLTAIAWEDMFDNGRHVFWRNNEIAGEAAVIHCLPFISRSPYKMKVAVIGRGNCAVGAIRALERLGAEVTVYNRKTVGNLRNEIGRYDIVVNAVLWDVFRSDHLVYKEDLKKMKKGSAIIDISCDEAMGIESSIPTTIEKPVYFTEGILHYAVDHTPSLFFKSASESISEAVSFFCDDLIEGNANRILQDATIIRDGNILDSRIIRFQKRQ